MAKWKKNCNPDLIAKQLEEAKSFQNDGKVTFEMTSSNWGNAIFLQNMLSLNENIGHYEKQKIVRKAYFNVGEKGQINAKNLIIEINKLENEYLRLPVKKYYLLTSISINPTITIKRLIIDNCHINFLTKLPTPSSKARAELLEDAKFSLTADLPLNYKPIKISTFGKSQSEAVNNALDALDFVRATWNLWLNHQARQRMSSGKVSQVNKIVLGPIHTLHGEDGKLATNDWWYQPEYREKTTPFNQADQIKRMQSFLVWTRKRLKNIQYVGEFKNALIRYGRALDLNDSEASFLKLWGTLEQLTDTGKDGYDKTIKRTLFLPEDKEYHREILNHLRDYRNRAVHAGTKDEEIETYLFQLKKYVEVLLLFHLKTKFKFNSFTHFAKFLELPKNKQEIDSIIKLHTYAKKFFSN